MPEIKINDLLNPAYIKVRPERKDIETFKANFVYLLDILKATSEEGEETHKKEVSGFLEKTYYDGKYRITMKGNMDLVILNSNDPNDTVGVIIETKKPSKKNDEMVTRNDLNKKAMQQLLLYFLNETEEEKNQDIKTLIITDSIEWYIFDAKVFYEHFSTNKLINLYSKFRHGEMLGDKTEYFYKTIAFPYIEEVKERIEFVYINIKDYENILKSSDKEEDNKLISLYKLLSPETLLKLPVNNDSNILDNKFYTELLYIMGLSEKNTAGKVMIDRNPGKRVEGSLIESIISELQNYSIGKSEWFEISMELVITWINRILFLKLLESQLLEYNNNNEDYLFLNNKKIKCFPYIYYFF